MGKMPFSPSLLGCASAPFPTTAAAAMACLAAQQLHFPPHNWGVQRRRHHSRVPRAGAAAEGPGGDEGGMRSSTSVVYSQTQADVGDKIPFPCTVPLLPFTVEEVLLPGSVKTLHLFEARYLALLDTVLAQPGRNKVFGHVVVEQQGDAFGETAASFPGAYNGDGFVFLMATLVRVVEVKKTFVGALVRIQAEARAEVTELTQTYPYFEGRLVPLCDQPLQDTQLVTRQVEQLLQTVRDLQNLTQRFKSKQSASLQQAVYWADRAVLVPAVQPGSSTQQQQQQQQSAPRLKTDTAAAAAVDADSSLGQPGLEAAAEHRQGEADGDQQQQQQQVEQQDMQVLSERAARLSFAALQGVPQESAKDQMKLLRCCVKAMKVTDTSTRLTAVQDHMQNSLNLLAAKCALKSLNLS